MGFIEAVKISFRKYFDFSSRSSRSEYWFFMLFLQIIYWFGVILYSFTEYLIVEQINIILLFGLLIPHSTVCIRRLHDVNRSGWWGLIFLSIIGIFPLIYWMGFKKGDANENEYGHNPLK